MRAQLLSQTSASGLWLIQNDRPRSTLRAIGCTAVVVLLALVISATVCVRTYAQRNAEKLSRSEVNTLISQAKTRADHERLAQYYRAMAEDYTADAKEHQAMVSAYKANPTLVNNKNRAATLDHCEYFVKVLNELATKSQELAALHERMAGDAH